MSERTVVIIVLIIYFSPLFYQIFLVVKQRKKGSTVQFKKLIKFTKLTFLLLISISIVIAVLSHTNYLDYQKPMTFDEYDEITFENFRGIELFRKTLHGHKEFAYIASDFDLEIYDSILVLQALFYPSRSFVYNKKSNSEELLNHEKYHFKITELFARKAKAEISNLESPTKDDLYRILNNIKKEKSSYQISYDEDSYHSYIYGEQKRYEKEIDSLLNNLSNFKNPKIKFNDKD